MITNTPSNSSSGKLKIVIIIMRKEDLQVHRFLMLGETKWAYIQDVCLHNGEPENTVAA